MRISGTGTPDVVRWDVVVAPLAGDGAGFALDDLEPILDARAGGEAGSPFAAGWPARRPTGPGRPRTGEPSPRPVRGRPR